MNDLDKAMYEIRIQNYRLLLKSVIETLQFYDDIKFSSRWGVPCEAQWLAHNTIKKLKEVLAMEALVSVD